MTDKVPLHEHVPLETPFVLAVEPSGVCNLKCKFCVHSLPVMPETGAGGRLRVLMSDTVFEKIIQDLKGFNAPLKLVYFSQIGEPLLNKRTPEMIKRLHKEKLTQKTTVFSNAIPLTEERSLALVDSGLSRIKISINGLSEDDYERNCGVRIDFDNLVHQITYLFKNRKNLVVQIKTLDRLLMPGGEERFYRVFGNICDQINIERIFPIFSEVDYDSLYFGESEKPESRFAFAQSSVKICALPFYRMAVAADGTVNLCYTDIEDLNIKDSSLKEIWESTRRKKLLRNLLQQRYEGISKKCSTCVCGHEQADEKDDLYPYREEVLQRLASVK